MRISIIVINQDSLADLEQTINCLQFQSEKSFEIVVIDSSGKNNQTVLASVPNSIYANEDANCSFYQLANIAVNKSNGEYCIILSGGEQLANDRVIEELNLNKLDKDIIFCNLISNNSSNKEDLFVYNAITAKSLILDTISLKSSVIKKSVLLELQLFNEDLLEMASWEFFVKAILAYGKTFKHVNMFLTICDMNSEINNIKLLPFFTDQIKNILLDILPMYANIFIDYKCCVDIRESEEYFVLSKFSKTKVFKIYIKFRDSCIKHGIYYKQKAYIRKLMLYQKIKKRDKISRKIVDKQIFELPHNYLKRNVINDEDVIVSLTSYSYRVVKSAPYAIFSLFTQSLLPNRIILYLGKNEWNDENIPDNLKRLKLSGLEIVYCDDIKSYKKLIPALEEFPNNVIITFDDDVYYHKEIVAELLVEYRKSDKRSVICHRGALVERRLGEFLPYNQWKDYIYGNKYSLYSPIGVNGVLYPGDIYDEEIFKKEIFMKYAPFADDLWFWLMSYRLGINIIIVEFTSQEENLNVDTMDQLIRKNSTALNFINFVDGANDTQLKLLLEYYQLK